MSFFHVAQLYVVKNVFPTENEDSKCSIRLRPESPTVVEEENLIKESLRGALRDSDDEGNEMWGGLFQKRHKTEAEVVRIALGRVHTQFNLWLVCNQHLVSDGAVSHN